MESKMQTHSEDVISLLRTGVALPSVSQVIEELLLNSIDAGASSIAVRVDLSCFKVQVVDNGQGITSDQFELIGERYATSKCRPFKDPENLHSYGYRGEALASIKNASSFLEVISRPKETCITLSKSFLKGKISHCSELANLRHTHGTTVTAHDLFYNMTVRRNKVNPALEIEKMKQKIASLALMWPNICISLRDDCLGSVIFKTKKRRSTLGVFLDLFPIVKAKDLIEMSESNERFTIWGFVGKKSHGQNDLQFLYINKRLVPKSNVHKQINKILGNSSKLKSKEKTSHGSNCLSSMEPGKGSPSLPNFNGIFLLNISCPFEMYDIAFNPGKLSMELEDLPKLNDLVQKMFHAFLKKENLLITEESCPQEKRNEIPLNDGDNESTKIESAYGNSISAVNISDSLFSKSVRRTVEYGTSFHDEPIGPLAQGNLDVYEDENSASSHDFRTAAHQTAQTSSPTSNQETIESSVENIEADSPLSISRSSDDIECVPEISAASGHGSGMLVERSAAHSFGRAMSSTEFNEICSISFPKGDKKFLNPVIYPSSSELFQITLGKSVASRSTLKCLRDMNPFKASNATYTSISETSSYTLNQLKTTTKQLKQCAHSSEIQRTPENVVQAVCGSISQKRKVKQKNRTEKEKDRPSSHELVSKTHGRCYDDDTSSGNFQLCKTEKGTTETDQNVLIIYQPAEDSLHNKVEGFLKTKVLRKDICLDINSDDKKSPSSHDKLSLPFKNVLYQPKSTLKFNEISKGHFACHKLSHSKRSGLLEYDILCQSQRRRVSYPKDVMRFESYTQKVLFSNHLRELYITRMPKVVENLPLPLNITPLILDNIQKELQLLHQDSNDIQSKPELCVTFTLPSEPMLKRYQGLEVSMKLQHLLFQAGIFRRKRKLKTATDSDSELTSKKYCDTLLEVEIDMKDSSTRNSMLQGHGYRLDAGVDKKASSEDCLTEVPHLDTEKITSFPENFPHDQMILLKDSCSVSLKDEHRHPMSKEHECATHGNYVSADLFVDAKYNLPNNTSLSEMSNSNESNQNANSASVYGKEKKYNKDKEQIFDLDLLGNKDLEASHETFGNLVSPMVSDINKDCFREKKLTALRRSSQQKIDPLPSLICERNLTKMVDDDNKDICQQPSQAYQLSESFDYPKTSDDIFELQVPETSVNMNSAEIVHRKSKSKLFKSRDFKEDADLLIKKKRLEHQVDNQEKGIQLDEKSDAIKRSSISCFVDNWKNPVFRRHKTLCLPNLVYPDRNTKKLCSSLFDGLELNNEMLQNVNVLGQVDNKYIACVIEKTEARLPKEFGKEQRLLVLFDQHAAHERIRLETLTSETSEIYENNKLKIYKRAQMKPPITLPISQDDVRVMKAFQMEFERIGVQFKFEESAQDTITLIICSLPFCLTQSLDGKERGQEFLLRVTKDLIKDHIHHLKMTNGSCGRMPLSVHRALCSQACHGAIRFGDPLDLTACSDLLVQLSKCCLPFQCAHGRPSVVPLINLNDLVKGSKTKKIKPQLERISLNLTNKNKDQCT